MADIFISYQRQERDAVAIVAEKLRALKFDVWFDEALRAGGSYDEEIASNLKAAKAVLVCWTPAAIASEWVRAEAAMAHNEGRLLAAFLEPTDLIPPFNLVHAENLMTWAGQEDDEAWLGLLARIGEMAGRPGVTSYYRAMRPEATAAELRAWAQANGADPLAEHVWDRIALIEGEDGAARIAREKAEARTRDLKRAENAARSKALAKARGLRDPKEQARRMLRLSVAVGVVALLVVGTLVYSTYANYVTTLSAQSIRDLDRIEDVQGVRVFMTKHKQGPIYDEALKKFYNLDVVDWAKTQADGSVQAYEKYLEDYSNAPRGKFVDVAIGAQAIAAQVAEVQTLLSRLRLYDGPASGKLDQATIDAITTFQYRSGAIVTGEPDALTRAALDAALAERLKTPLTEIPVGKVGPPSEDDFRRVAVEFKTDGPTLMALYDALSNTNGFEPDGSMRILYEPHIFSRYTKHRFDESNPKISAPRWGQIPYPRTQADRWAQFAEAAQLDKEAAFSAVSFGAFQFLGANYKDVGFATPQEFVFFLAESEAAQLTALMRYIETKNLRKALDARDWAGFARGYYGPSYAMNQYDRKLAAAYDKALASFQKPAPAFSAAVTP